MVANQSQWWFSMHSGFGCVCVTELLECADATRRGPVAREGVKHLHSAVAVLSLCESVSV